MPTDAPLPDEMPVYDLHVGEGPLVIAAPHIGTYIPEAIASAMTQVGRAVGETDFHVHRLFDFAVDLGATTLLATHSRYVIDLNRDPDGARLYPGRFETDLCPLTDFDHNPLYRPGLEPSPTEIAQRRTTYWQPYHDRLRAALDAAVARHGHALLIDAHSIRPAIPSLFEGRLPDLSFGCKDGATLAPALIDALDDWRHGQSAFSHVRDGRFKGGFTTRHYGDPARHVNALQIEIVQDTYLNTQSPSLYDEGRAAPLSCALRPLVERLLKTLPHI